MNFSHFLLCYKTSNNSDSENAIRSEIIRPTWILSSPFIMKASSKNPRISSMTEIDAQGFGKFLGVNRYV